MEAEQFVWKDEYSIGVESIDKEHKRLFKIVNKLFSFGREEPINPRACQEGIKFFKTHAVKHFADEEAYMESIGYEGLNRHKEIHRGFRENTLSALEAELEHTDFAPDAIDHFLGVCTGWLIGHTLTEDQAITGGQSHGTWGSLLPKEEVEVLKNVICKLVHDMFQLDLQLVSDTYGGEKFGKGVYYRLAFGTSQENVRQEVFMVFEEKLLLSTVGKILGVKAKKLDTKLVHAARYTTRQFVGRVMEQIPSEVKYELKEENLLSFEQFQEVFQKEKPQVSLLFNTGGQGYFAYSVIAPHLLEEGVGGSIQKDNAIEEVEKFLQKREEERIASAPKKKKILVVDDSLTIRQGMKSLLETDYEVTLASSGAATIRSIALDKPDLVLLDYEMPVCDGRQTLEMLRAEQEFANLPVIFLTGRRDRDTMINVMPLNPAGYLLKYLKPEEIKEKIDHFFAR